MNLKQKNMFFLAIMGMLFLFFFIIFGSNGLLDLNRLNEKKRLLVEENERIDRKNRILYHTIDRLKNDPAFIEDVARKELGMIGKDEMILKFKKRKIKNE